MQPKGSRLRLFITRLAAAPAATSHDEAFALIATILNAVEDEHSGIPANPTNWRTDGRMYPPQSDNARPAPDLLGVTGYRSVAHRTLIGANGALRIIDLNTGAVLVDKPGHDGKPIPTPAE